MLIWTYNNIIIKFKSNKIYIKNPILNLVKKSKKYRRKNERSDLLYYFSYNNYMDYTNNKKLENIKKINYLEEEKRKLY